jgi:serine/threonine protein kinase
MVRVFEYGESSGRLYFAMELCNGRTLREILDTAPPDLATACAIASTLFSVIHDIHGRGVIHRDLKPENILFKGDDALERRRGSSVSLVFLDFGSRANDGYAQTHTRTGLVTGTVDYLSPEYLRGKSLADATLDFYSLGIIFYELLTGHTPYSRKDEDMMQRIYAIVYGEAACAPANWFQGFRKPFHGLVMSLIEKDRTSRVTDFETDRQRSLGRVDSLIRVGTATFRRCRFTSSRKCA